MTRLIIAILFISVSTATFAGIYDLRFRRVASFKEQDVCRAFAEKVAGELVKQSGATIIDQGCEEDDFTNRGLDAVITYQASASLSRISSSTVSVYSEAFYSDRKTCLNELEGQRKLFTKATGLPVLVSYCMLDLSASPQLWESRVDGLGESKLNVYSAGLAFLGTITDSRAVLASFQGAAEGYGLTVFEAGINPTFGRHIVLRFYSAEPYSLRDYSAMKYENAAACSAARETVRNFMKTADKPVTVFCEENSDRVSATLHVASFVQTLKPVGVFKAKALTKNYSTLAACQQASAAITPSKDVFAGICAGFGSAFRIHLFSR